LKVSVEAAGIEEVEVRRRENLELDNGEDKSGD